MRPRPDPDLFLSDPQPDESIYSLIARYHIISGNPRAVVTANEIFDKSRGIFYATPLGVDLKRIASCAPSHSPLSDVQHLITHHTCIPYAICFAPACDEQQLRLIAIEKGVSNLRRALAIIASVQGKSFHLRYCPACSQQDCKNLGYSYWRITHQLPMVSFCHDHQSPLVVGCSNCRRRVGSAGRHLLLPHQLCSCEEPAFEEAHRYGQLDDECIWLALESSRVLLKSRQMKMPGTPADRRKILGANGYLLSGGLDLTKIKSELRKKFSDESLAILTRVAGTPVTTDKSWIRNELNPRKYPNTLRSMLLMSVVESWQEKCWSISSVSESGGEEGNWKSKIGRLMELHRGNISEVAKELNKHWNTVRNEVATQELVYCRRGASPHERFGTEKYAAIRAALERGDPLMEITKSFHIGIQSLAPLLSDSPDIRVQREAAISEREAGRLLERRKMLLDAIAIHGCKTRQHLRKRLGHQYVFLFQRDRVWLEANVPALTDPASRGTCLAGPQERRRSERGPKDVVLSGRVREIAQSLRRDEVPPQRLTKCRLLQELGFVAQFYKKAHHFPLLSQAVSDETETRADFYKRRLNWAIDQVSQTHAVVSLSNLTRTSGLDRRMISSLSPWIEQTLSQQGLVFKFASR